jgi:hypothetical protein
MYKRYAVIPSNGRECLYQCVEAIEEQVDQVIVVDTSIKSPHIYMNHPKIRVLGVSGRINISRWWNIGLNYAEGLAEEATAETWDVAILNDDAIVPYGWFKEVSDMMSYRGSAAGCSGGHNITWDSPSPVPLDMRMQGFAFIVAGQFGLRANEDLRWYFTDDYIDWESRKLGGMTMVKGYPVDHLHPNGQVTSEIQEIIAHDAEVFVSIYESRPW